MATYEEFVERLLSFDDRELGTGASAAEIETAERALGVSLAGGYRAFLMEFGWGAVGYMEFYGLGKGVPAYLDLVNVTLSEREEMRPKLRHDLIPLMNDGGGNLYCLDTSSTREPPVVFWDHATGPDQVPEMKAENFASWMLEQFDGL